MKKHAVWKLTPALIGLGSLLVYVLACTSFSPDDSKVLYDTVDAKTGVTGVAVYDRKSGKSELLFQPFTQDGKNLTSLPALLRPQWLEGGHSFLTTWRIGADDAQTSVNITILPFDKRGPARSFLVTGLNEDGSGSFYYWPVPVVGNYLFLTGQSNSLIRLNIVTGGMRREMTQQTIVPLPSPNNDHLFYFIGADNSSGPSEYGVLDPETFTRTPLFHIAGGKVSLVSMALSRDAKCFAYQVENENPPVIHLLETGKPPRTLSLASLGAKTAVSVRQFSPKGDLLYASFVTSDDVHTNGEYGFVEIPLDGSPMRKTVLISHALTGDKEAPTTFQIDLSHDGKTLAVESLWLAYGDASKPAPLSAEDCALFLVDVSKPEHKVTKVSIPLPPRDRPSPFEK